MSELEQISVQYVKGVGPARKKVFERLGVETVGDLFYLFPRRYEDRRQMVPLAEVKTGEFQTVTGRVITGGARQSWYTRKQVYETVIDDGTGRLYGVWFNQAYLGNYFKPGRRVVWYGKVDVYKKRLQMVSPEYEILEDDKDSTDAGNLNVGRIVPIYPLTRGITQRYLRKVLSACLEKYREHLKDILPVPVRNKYRLMNLKRSIENIHFPQDMSLQEEAFRRVSFEEFFMFHLSVMKRRMSIVRKPGIAHKVDLDTLSRFKALFPFALTPAQNRVIHEISRDLQSPTPMLRLLQGDVGSGKTLVALFGCCVSVLNGCQAAVMAPTEILARQHYETVKKFLGRKGGAFHKFRVDLLVSSQSKKEKDAVLGRLADGRTQVVVGTHALLGGGVEFQNLSFAVIDEQHKFGVQQRALLSTKGSNPDVLVMTATPIPRSLSLTLFGDLDVSVIDHMPPGRGPVKTRLFGMEKEGQVYERVRETVAQGRQAYIIYPLVEESDKLELKAATEMFRRLQKQDLKELKVGLVHGQMKREEADEVMAQFKTGDLQVLIATTVLEVGIDVPNASVMVIEHAERFGLAQLHQLRGRIGRGQTNGECLLLADPQTEEAQARLKAILSSTDGFKIAEQDLLIRGPGQYFGRHQHGLNELRYANPATQVDVLLQARKEAEALIHQDPDLVQDGHVVLRETMLNRYPNYLDLAHSG